MKKSVIWVVVLLLLAAAGYWLYKRYGQGPEYSLYKLKEAVDARDMQALEKYVDVEQTTTSLLNQTVQAGMADLPEQERAMAAMFLGMAMASHKDQMLEAIREQVTRYVEQGPAEGGPPAGVTQQEWEQVQALLPMQKLLEESQLAQSKLEGVSYVNRKDSLAVVGLDLRVPSRAEPVVVEVQMRDRNGYWQVIGLPNAGLVLKELGLLELWRNSRNLPRLKLRM
ncbi:DUF2939 domain-containing protein [Rufibacter quisquiliarum]|uniref:DUF2939 domain-containing protein n=1 Tax=Rufibacter quisquiliarum TaxID=1549639 RepID=A0A839GLP3_9BACT|nr:DUF2939 domain-containing protein [Rufibacter quisquiliarum]MBA9075857.1 hypothetical protein [Rufibacter quisquiliarum]